VSGLDAGAARIVLRRLRDLQRGRLEVQMPDGATHRFQGEEAGPSARVVMHRARTFRRILLEGDTGAGASFAEGDWDADDLVAVIGLVIENRPALGSGTRPTRLFERLLHRLRRNTVRGARRNIARHYDLGNEFFELFLDPTMTYSAAVFEHADEDLATAQTRKYRRLAEKGRIGPGNHVLEIGCGWGGFAEFAAREIGCRVTGVTISAAQAEYARERVLAAGLADRVSIEQVDYRRVTGSFDRIISIEMLEAVGHANLSTWFAACDRLLAPGGVMAIQVITIPDQRYAEYRRGSDFIRRYIFPGGHLPSLGAIGRALERQTSLGIEDLENIAPHYAETLRRWRLRLLERRDAVLALGFDETFVRRWEYYLAYCEAAFAGRALSDLQLVLSRPGNGALGDGPYAGAAA
jgi:cyclopropane-fatty-acyl-phospholipid synthase